MTFADLPAGESIFLDANILVYHFGPHPVFGPSCQDLVQRSEKSEILAFSRNAVDVEGFLHSYLEAISREPKPGASRELDFAWSRRGVSSRDRIGQRRRHLL